MRIVLVRTDRIGDLILSTPAIATVRASFPDARITMVCSPYNRIVMDRNTDVDDLVELRRDAKPGEFGARFRGQTDIAIALAPRKPDLQVVGATRAPLRVGYTYVRRYVARLTARLYVNRLMISEADPDLSDRDPHRHVRHEVNQLLDLVELAGADKRVNQLRLEIADEDRAAIAYLPQAPLVLHLGMRWFRDGSTLQSTLLLMKELRHFGVPLVVTYAPECEQFVKAIAESRQADVLLGGLAFFRWAAVFERARVIITVDTGATHVASAVRRPTVVAFEHRYFRLNSQEWSPYGVPQVLVRKPGDESPESLARFRGEILDAVAQLMDHA
ncbi:MAG TPA: glycosyltransferase family 9 protein [Candidatus Baltobacteraceae bacterium]|nr:glycosyltransferase family 9 protein [Candidatus Baltobacteraceae bacterium]